jgi:hypothetical protein
MGVSAAEVGKGTALAVLSHPIAVQILVACNEEEISPSRFVEQRFRPKPQTEKEFKNALSRCSYHFRALEGAGCVEIVDMIPRRGTFERIYKGTDRAHFSDEEWTKVPPDERVRISKVAWQSVMARVENAMLAETFDKRDDRWMAWTAAKLDERGWAEMVATIAANYARLEIIREDAEARLEETGEEPINATFSMFGFESPGSVNQT